MIYKESPLCSRSSAFGHESSESLPAYLINLLPERFGTLSVSIWALLQHFWGPTQDLEGVVFTSCHWLSIPSPPGGLPLQGTTRPCWFTGGTLSPSKLRRWILVAQRNLERLRNQPWSPTHQTGKNLGSNSGLPQESEGDSDQLSKGTLVSTFFGGETVRFRLQGGSTVLHESVWKHERRSLVMKRVHGPWWTYTV
jgi:hypothetical protein